MIRYKILFRIIIIIFLVATFLLVIPIREFKSKLNKNVHYCLIEQRTHLNDLQSNKVNELKVIEKTTQSIMDNLKSNKVNEIKGIKNTTISKPVKTNFLRSPIQNAQRKETPIEGVKTILFWTPYKYDPLYYLKEKGHNGFIKQCKVNNCFATDDRQLFGENITKFDVIVFNGQAFKENQILNDLPKVRSDYQKYVFYETQSASDNPLCSNKLENFFNWTMTYKLDSDISCPFIIVKNKTGHIVGPNEGMIWKRNAGFRSDYNRDIKSKTQLAAWFPTDCTRLRAPLTFTYMLKEALTKHKLDVVTYGNCGPFVCVKGNRECDYINRHYFYLLTLENSLAKDYVTDKVLAAFQNNVVPVVYGGADYSRFLPPGSYIDGSKLTPEEVALNMVSSMLQYNRYQTHFEWKQHYSFHKAEQIKNICYLCAAVNNEANVKQRKVYKHFRRWWNPEYTEKCFKNGTIIDDD